MHEHAENPLPPAPTASTVPQALALNDEVARLLRLIKSEPPATPGTSGASLSRQSEGSLARMLRYRLIFSSGLYAWYRLPDCEIPIALPLWPGKVEHYDQQKRIVLVRPAIAGYEHELEAVHLTQVLAWFQVNLSEGVVREVLLHAPPAEATDARAR